MGSFQSALKCRLDVWTQRRQGHAQHVQAGAACRAAAAHALWGVARAGVCRWAAQVAVQRGNVRHVRLCDCSSGTFRRVHGIRCFTQGVRGGATPPVGRRCCRRTSNRAAAIQAGMKGKACMKQGCREAQEMLGGLRMAKIKHCCHEAAGAPHMQRSDGREGRLAVAG